MFYVLQMAGKSKYTRELHLLGGNKWSFVCLTYGLSHKQALYDIIISFKLIHS